MNLRPRDTSRLQNRALAGTLDPDIGSWGNTSLTIQPMTDSRAEQTTRLLNDWQSGDRKELDRLMPLVYKELRTVASRHLAHERSHHAIQTTALVHEASVKLVALTMTGHKTRSVFERYTIVSGGDLREAARKLDLARQDRDGHSFGPQGR